MNDLNWNIAKPITFEHLRSRYSYGDLVFSGFALYGPLDGVLHLSNFRLTPDICADLFVLFKDIRKISQAGVVTHPNLRYEVETIDPKQGIKRLTLQYENGKTEIEYKDDLLCLCRLPSGEMKEI